MSNTLPFTYPSITSAVLFALLTAATGLPTFSADKNGVSPNVISLPTGPGSIEGLGESFQPHLNTGTAKYAIGIKLPPGVAGHDPALTLAYEGGGGNGPLGYGWSLPIPMIQRRSDHGIPTYGEDVGLSRIDTFITETREELVPHSSGYYFLKNEGPFIRYKQVGESWEGTLPNGTRLEFGITGSGRIHDGAKVFAWLLERQTDTRGNVITYRYETFPEPNNDRQKYLVQVSYGSGAPPWSNYHFVRFEYEDRPDWFEDCRAGFAVRTAKRLRKIIVATDGPSVPGHLQDDFDGDGVVDNLNRRYELRYFLYAGAASHWSLLGEVTPVGADGTNQLPSTTFGYAITEPPDEVSAVDHSFGGVDVPPTVMDNTLAEFLDVNGDALPDIIKTEVGGGSHMAFLNLGATNSEQGGVIQWDSPRDMTTSDGAAWNYNLDSSNTHLADMDGDGLADLVHKSAADEVFYFRNLGRSAWGTRQDFSAEGAVPPAPHNQADVRTADLDFDKRTDIVQSISAGQTFAYRIWFNLGSQSYSAPVTVEPESGFDFADRTVQISDFNGDRVPDIIRIRPEALEVTIGLGYGRFAPLRNIVIPEETLDDAQLARSQLTDINGDGLADLVIPRAAPGECWYWLNLGNYTLTERKQISGMPTGVGQNAVTRWADINGNGTTDFVLADRESSPRLQAVDFRELLGGSTGENLLRSITNGLGLITLIEYQPSTRYALEDARSGNPWTNIMPHSVNVVASVTNLDSLGHVYVTRFQYHNGYYDPFEKQFRGFETVEQIDVGDLTAPSLISESHFDTGAQFESMKGKLLSLRLKQEDGKLFSDETTSYTLPPRTLLAGTNGIEVNYAPPMNQQTRISELGQGTERLLETEFAYDNFGNLIREADFGIVTAEDRSAFDDERVTTTAFALNTNAWILRLPSRKEIADEQGIVLSRTESFYDDETFSGTNFGQVTIGNLTLTRAWIIASNETSFINASRTKYDPYGNPVVILDPLGIAPQGTIGYDRGHVREVHYDAAFHTYPIEEIVHIGDGKPALALRASYDQAFGVIVSSTDFNGNNTAYQYDAFSRLTGVVKPYDSADFPTLEYEYALAVAFGSGLVNYVETRQLDKAPGSQGSDKRDHYLVSRVYSDGLGRTLMTRQEGESEIDGTAPRVVVSGATTFNLRQKPNRILAPYFTLMEGSSLDALLAYESVQAADWKGEFHEDGNLIELAITNAHQTSIFYDATLRTVKTVEPDGSFRQSEFEPSITRNYDENDTDLLSPFANTPVVVHRDGLGRLIQTDELTRLSDDGIPGSEIKTWSTFYSYDLNDCLTRVVDSQGNRKEMTFDGLKRRVSMRDPNTGLSTNIYDSAGNLIEQVDAKQQRITYSYDGANRILHEDYHDESSGEFRYGRSPDVSFHYDAPADSVDQGDGTTATANNIKGMLAWVSDTSGEEHISYDNRGRTQWTVKRIPDPVLDPEFTLNPSTLVAYKTSYEYDSFDRVIRMRYPDNDEVAYQFDDRGLLSRIVGGPSGSIISNIIYTPSGQQLQVEYGNGVRTTHGFDERQRLARLTTLAPEVDVSAPRVSLIDFEYEFDAVSNIRQIHDRRPTLDIPAESARRNTQTYDYDDLYRLTRARYNLPNPSSENGGEITYRYDRIGNILEQRSTLERSERNVPITNVGVMDSGGTSGRFNRSARQPNDPPGPHALTSIRKENSNVRTFDYDANGNIKEIDGLSCTWDFRDRLVGVEDDEMQAKYRYDFRGRRVIKQVVPKEKELNPTGNKTNAVERSAIRGAVSYPSLDFEVREHDQPTKYVFHGSTRVAQIIGSLSAVPRIQRLRLSTGWNLLSMAVLASNLLSQVRHKAAGVMAYRWDSSSGYTQVTTNESLAPDTILWLLSSTNVVSSVVGLYSDPISHEVSEGSSFVPGARLEKMKLPPALAHALSLWVYNPFGTGWKLRLHGDLSEHTDLPTYLAPGTAVFMMTTNSTSLPVPDADLRVRYYHQDHLGSTAISTDASGKLLEETTYFPFGGVRHEHHPSEEGVSYHFTQKERDGESGLDYLEARFLSTRLARFLSCDPKFLNVDRISRADLNAFLSIPAKGNIYAYALNNPVRYVDPDGLDDLDKVGTGIDVIGFVNSFAEASDALENNPAVKVAGKTVTVLSLGIKATQFINDPSADTGGQLAYEGTKTLISVSVPPVGVLLAVLDLAGVGPSDALADIEKSIKYNRAATKSYNDATKNWRKAESIYREGAQVAGQRLENIRTNLEKLERGTRDLIESDRRTAAEIKRLEREVRRLKRQERGYLERARKASE